MALADYAAFKTAYNYPNQHVDHLKAWQLTSGLAWCSSWIGTPGAGSVPGASAVTTAATAGAIPLGAISGGKELRLAIKKLVVSTGLVLQASTIIICDRLVHMGGLSGTVTTAQTVSTSALTRFTSGAGVIAALEIYTAVGATATTATINYTNDAGVAGQTSQPVVFGGVSFQNLNRLLPISLAAGDAGVRAISTVTLAASTLTAGNFGLTLFKPITPPISPSQSAYTARQHPILDVGGYMGLIDPNACLWAIILGGGQAQLTMQADYAFMED